MIVFTTADDIRIGSNNLDLVKAMVLFNEVIVVQLIRRGVVVVWSCMSLTIIMNNNPILIFINILYDILKCN